MAKKATWTIIYLSFGLKAVTTNFFFLISSTYLVIRRAPIVVYNLQLSFCSKMLILILLLIRKTISNAISILMSIKKKVSSKNQDFLVLLSIKKNVIIIPNVSRVKPSISKLQLQFFEFEDLVFWQTLGSLYSSH